MKSCLFSLYIFQKVKPGCWVVNKQQSHSQRKCMRILKFQGKIILGHKQRTFIKSWKTWSIQPSFQGSEREGDLPMYQSWLLSKVHFRTQGSLLSAHSWSLSWNAHPGPGFPWLLSVAHFLQLKPPSPWSVDLASGKRSYSWSEIGRL